jgi:hypothetical protein
MRYKGGFRRALEYIVIVGGLVSLGCSTVVSLSNGERGEERRAATIPSLEYL